MQKPRSNVASTVGMLTFVVQRARTGDPTLPTLVRLLRSFETLPEERQEESLAHMHDLRNRHSDSAAVCAWMGAQHACITRPELWLMAWKKLVSAVNHV